MYTDDKAATDITPLDSEQTFSAAADQYALAAANTSSSFISPSGNILPESVPS